MSRCGCHETGSVQLRIAPSRNTMTVRDRNDVSCLAAQTRTAISILCPPIPQQAWHPESVRKRRRTNPTSITLVTSRSVPQVSTLGRRDATDDYVFTTSQWNCSSRYIVTLRAWSDWLIICLRFYPVSIPETCSTWRRRAKNIAR